MNADPHDEDVRQMVEDHEAVLDMTRQLLDAIAAGDWARYEELCDPTLTCFEPEAKGHLVEGLPFHHFYFKLGGPNPSPNPPASETTIASPHVRLLGDTAIVSYVRLNQRLDGAGKPYVQAVEETRVWERQGDVWRHVHLHRSLPGA